MTLAPTLPDRDDWTVDDLAQLPPDLRYELINGRLISLPSAVGVHNWICRHVANALEAECPSDLMVVNDLSLAVDHRNEPRPDVVIIPEKDSGVSPAPIRGALLVAEVISPESRTRDRRDKTALFARARVQTYWVIDPRGDQISLTERVLMGDLYQVVTETEDVFVTERPWKTAIDLPAFTARRDRALGPPSRRR
ncbi:Uma2 family endonuclease [Catenuloplanes sp. NPDC051500]|uniref:Uma2 family endonuclease n=1 Tax=Catenuloplanes sp. NPDC051500 TaxID=3363959 RepID=UPI003795FAC2